MKQASKANNQDNDYDELIEPDQDKEGNPMFDLTNKRKVFIKNFKGNVLVDLRETFEKNGEMMYGAKGLALTLDQWQTLKGLIGSIDREIQRVKKR